MSFPGKVSGALTSRTTQFISYKGRGNDREDNKWFMSTPLGNGGHTELKTNTGKRSWATRTRDLCQQPNCG